MSAPTALVGFLAVPYLRVQAVLYQTSPDQVSRWAAGVARSVAMAGSVHGWTVGVGDCSPAPCLDAEQAERLAGALRGAGASRVDYRPFAGNLGHGGGQNALFDGDDADLLLILNPDCVASPWLVDRLVGALLADPGWGAADGRQLPLEHPKDFDRRTGEASWVSGACTVFRSAAYRQVDGFDAGNFPLYADDVDLSWRLRLAGWRVRYVPAAPVFHDKRLTASGGPVFGRPEVVTSAAAWLMITHRYSYPAGLNHWRHFLLQSDDAQVRAVVADFDARVAAGDLPEPVDPEHRVAALPGPTFGAYRW
jgi:GT2 family glycosyltransferase